ncbi:MAG: hypothetical protein ACD_2C00153G0005 [uncultured bacterium (gcode 4)]|uniref:Aerobactin siderophore biosynthesis IucA/IucC N-terminal domain-containing protein n=1 Tax=uncultured bacterium (gcode 4) TaxID=1234023 RepID=K2GGI7_9BACT|nr:MAG: hypothetical protein ACD_2C00153G0005 [uncultured bacterium (gcode 4)]
MRYNIGLEYINIENYSPFCHINEMSLEYRYSPFQMPFILHQNIEVPVHPDTFEDLKLSKKDIIYTKEVHPTSSFRTVFLEDENIFLKVPLLRNITRWLRDLPAKQVLRAHYAAGLLEDNKCVGFDFLREEWKLFEDERYNFIKRTIPDTRLYPLFYIIKSQDFEIEFILRVMKNIISTWAYYASQDIYLEYHTQNILIDDNANIHYRDLSDIKSYSDSMIKASFIKYLPEKKDFNSLIFDRAICNQNFDFILKYHPEIREYIPEIKSYIRSSIEKYGLNFPSDYSYDFDYANPERIPERTTLVSWRK